MFTLSVRIFRSLINQRSLKLIFKNFPICSADLRWNFQTITSNLVTKTKVPNLYNEPLHEDVVRKTAKLINEYPNSEYVKWEELKGKLNELNVTNHRLAILQACLKLKNLDVGISYFDYITKNGEEFTPAELVFFLKLFSIRKDQILKHESVVKYIYENIKVYMKSNVIQNYIIALLSEVPTCFYDLMKNIFDEKMTLSGAQKLAKKAFKLKNAELAYEIMNSYNINFNYVFESYIDYLCQMAIEKKFSPDMITKCIKFCENKNNIFSNNKFLFILKTLVNNLNKHDNNYVWMLKTCHIDHFNVCSECKTKLVDKCISKSDFESLKKAFLPTSGLTDQAVFLNSSDKEVQNFLKFLNSCKPYNIVFDGLNLMYLHQNLSGDLSRVLKYFLDQGMSALIVARIHAQKKVNRMHFLKKKNYADKCQFFFTENLSDDDLFVLYAALHGGLGTYLISGDFLQCYGASFDEPLKQIFFKWKSYHQYVMHQFTLHPPLPYLGLSQLTTDTNGKKFIWHISYSADNVTDVQLSPLVPKKWVCLQAEKKLS